jgi:hypothetical protein
MRCQVLVRATEVVDERSIRRRLLQGVQRRPVDVLQHGMPEQLRVLGRADHRRERTQPGFPSGAPPTLAHDELEAVVGIRTWTYHHRLQNADHAD